MQLDHFHYRVNVNMKKREDGVWLRTYDQGRIIHDLKLQVDQDFWKKITFPRSKVNIDKIVISKGVEIDSISLNYYMKIKERIHYWMLAGISASSFHMDPS